MSNITVLGSGRVGSAIARDLLEAGIHVLAIDHDEHALARLAQRYNIATRRADVTDASQLAAAVNGADWVVSALPGKIGFQILARLIELDKNCVDISFFPEDGFELDATAKQKGVTVLFDAGVAPGLDHFVFGYHHNLAPVRSFRCLVGGLPVMRCWPFYYKAPFSPADVLEEYTRPARLKESGRLVQKPALSDLEYVEFPGIGTLQAFVTDGLRSLLHTAPDVENLSEKTLRYPGHVESILLLREAGFFSTQAEQIGGMQVTPRQISEVLLARHWRFADDEADFTLLRLEIETGAGVRKQCIQYDLLDHFDAAKGILSMARTTGYTATALLHCLMLGLFQGVGTFAPEQVGANPVCFDFVMDYLKKRGIEFIQSVRSL